MNERTIRPRLRRMFDIVPLGEEAALVAGPGLFVRIADPDVRILHAVRTHLDGTATQEELADRLRLDPTRLAHVVRALDSLELLEAPGGGPPDDDAVETWLAALTRDPAGAARRARAARVVIVGDPTLVAAIAMALDPFGLATTPVVDPLDEPSKLDLDALLGDHDHMIAAIVGPEPFAFDALHGAARTRRVPFTTVHLEALDATIGPTVVGDSAACHTCYTVRRGGARTANDRRLAHQAARLDAATPTTDAISSPASVQHIAALAAQQVFLFAANVQAPPLVGHVLHADLVNGTTERHRVLRMPRCPSCSGPVPVVDRLDLEPLPL